MGLNVRFRRKLTLDTPKLHSLERVKESVKQSLSELTFIPNLLLIHNPFIPADGQLAEFWGWLEGLVEDGTLKGTSLGVSNFRPVDIETVMKVAKIKPVVNRELYTYVAPTTPLKTQKSNTTHTL